MSATASTSSPSRSARAWVAILASIALVFGSALIATPALAAVDGYDVSVTSNGEAWRDAQLGFMTQGAAYSDSIQAPPEFEFVGEYYVENLPAGLEATPRASDLSFLDISGIPVGTDPLDLAITVFAPVNLVATLRITGPITPAKTAAPTTMTSASLMSISDVNLSATVTGVDGGSPTGTVQFTIGGTAVGDPVAVTDGVASVVGASGPAARVGFQQVVAFYSGDDDYNPSADSRYIEFYGTQISGLVLVNDVPQVGNKVFLTSDDAATLEATTDENGRYTFQPEFNNEADAERAYLACTTLAGNSACWVSASAPMTWNGTDRNIRVTVAPVWTDTTIATPRIGSAYTDSVAAFGSGAVYYQVTSGWLPNGLSLGTWTGAITGTPNCILTFAPGSTCDYEFTITANNFYGTITHDFTGTLLEAGIAPTWTAASPTELDLQLTVPFVGGVAAEGDPTITYAVTSGAVPTGLSLDPATGAITGTPQCGIATPFPFFAPFASTDPCDYSFTITATNSHGSVPQAFTGTIAAVPALDLVLDFTAGTPLTSASSTISASGLKLGSEYALVMHSTPVTLYTGTIGASGAFTWNVALPANTPAGSHRLILTGVAPDGSTMTAEAWFTLLASGSIGAISYAGPIAMGLPVTGADVTVPVGAGAGLLLLGGILLVGARRRARSI